MSLRSDARPAGLTLVEVLVAIFLGSLVLYLLITLLIPALRLSSQGTTRVDLDQRGAIASNHLVAALRRTSRAGVAAADAGSVKRLSIHQLQGTLSGSRQNWSRDLTLFSWKNKVLQKRSYALSNPPSRAVAPSLEDLMAMPEESVPRLKIEDVEEFEVTINPGPRVDFRLVFAKNLDILRLERSVFLVNSSQ